MNKRKVCVVTGSRSDYDLFYPILNKIKLSKILELQLVATSSHLSSDFGLTYKEIENDGFTIDEKVDNLEIIKSSASVVKSAGKAMILLSDCFIRLKPDLILLLGDRYEAHAAASSAIIMNIPLAHIHGGEITEGAIDEKIRHSITKMSSLHFCSNAIHRDRIIQMGENPSSVINSGAPAIDNINNIDLISLKKLEVELNFSLKNHKTALITYHPETLSNKDLMNEINHIFNVLLEDNLKAIFTYANADNGGRQINKLIEIFCKKNSSKFKVFRNLGRRKYLSLMSNIDLLIGNTSSGIIEAASFKKPVVNIGDRQKGRVRNINVIDADIRNLRQKISLALSEDFLNSIRNIKNLYGDGNASKIIVSELESHKFSPYKAFYDRNRIIS
tara:strand:- start:4046 stop:5209 length:1164 start_codon:yes stop_codon:yes gene_type:complete